MGVRFPRHGKSIYRTQQWKAVRMLAKRRDGFKCVQCGARGRLEVDHIKPIRDGGAPFDMENTQCLCVPCHSRKTRLEIGLGRKDPERDRWQALLKDFIPIS